MHFEYKAKQTTGQVVAGTIAATSQVEAHRQLREQELFPLSLQPQTKTGTNQAKSSFRIGSGVKKADLLMLTSQLSIMCQSEIDLAEALQHVASQCTKPALKKILDEVYRDVSSGKPVSEALSKHTRIFGEAYVASIAAGEASGTLTEVLGRLADLLKNEIRLRSTVSSALAYPIVLSGVAFIVLAALVFFVLPQFADVFTNLGAEAPPATQMLMDSAKIIRDYFLVIGVVFVVAVLSVFRFGFTDRASRHWDGVILHNALLRGATRSLLTGRTFRLLGTMLQSGIPLLESIRLCRSSVKNRVYRGLFDAMERDVLNGEGIGQALAAASFVPAGAVQMATTAERTGKLGPVMQSVGEFYEDDGERRVQQLAKLLEPVIIVVMGAVVAGVVLAVMLPLLDVSTMSK